MTRLPEREAAEPRGDIPSIVESIESITNADQRRHARLRLRDDELSYRLQAKRMRRRERLADGLAKSIGGSLLTGSIALLLGGHVGGGTIELATLGLFVFGVGTTLVAATEYQGAAWDSEADRITAALDEVEKYDADR